MKQALIFFTLFALVLPMAGCGAAEAEPLHIGSIRSYRDIPGVTDKEIDSIEALKAAHERFIYGQMYETEAFVLPDGTYAGFATKVCALLSDLFDVPFVQEFYEWDELKGGLDNMEIDFTGDLTPTAERMRFYYMTHPIAERTQRLFTHVASDDIIVEKDLNGLRVGFLKGAIDHQAVLEGYPELVFKYVEVDGFAAAASQLETGELDAFVTEGVIDPFFDEFGFIRSKEFFSLIFTPVSLTTANPELEPIIAVVNKYLAAGGIDKLFAFYKEGDAEYARYKLDRSFTYEEKAFLADLSARSATVKIALEHDNYPVCFYNKSEREFQGIAVDVLAEISALTGITFETVNNENTPWSEIFAMLREGQASMVSQLLRSDERVADFLWTDAPYASADYALLSKAEFPSLASYQVVRTTVGVTSKSAYHDKYNEWFPDSANVAEYGTNNEALDALEAGDIDMLMASDYVLLMQLNYREKPGFKVNVRFNVPMNSYFGFNKKESVLRSVVGKAQAFIKTDLIADDWTSRGFDYSKKMTQQRLMYLMAIVGVLILLLTFSVFFLIRSRRFSRGLEELVQKRTYELAQQTQEAQVASSAKSSFLARMSHEIRTPLNAIIGMAGIAKNSVSDPNKSLYSINQIISSSHHLLAILNDVLDMSKIESGKLELSYAPFSLRGAYNEVSAIIAQRCQEKKIAFNTNLDAIDDVILVGDKLRLNQVLINLLGNAVKFTGNAGRIVFLAHVLHEDEKCASIRFSVADNGIGMSAEQQAKLFFPFEQTDSTIATKFGGTGLGLSISQNLVGMMGGVIKVESAPGTGSKFYFDLRFEKGSLADDAADTASAPLNLQGKRILLVEDVEINRIIVIENLTPTGAKIDEADNGQRAVHMFERSGEGYYSLIFMDVQMPVMDGYEATRRIRLMERADARSIPIIAMTANAYKEDVEAALEAGMNGHLSKPIDVSALKNMLVKHLSRIK